jgi:hypothetical protein
MPFLRLSLTPGGQATESVHRGNFCQAKSDRDKRSLQIVSEHGEALFNAAEAT